MMTDILITNSANGATTNSFPSTGPIIYNLAGNDYDFLCMEYTTPSDSGLTLLDTILTQRHILRVVCFDEARQFLGVAVNRDGNVTAFDLSIMNQVHSGLLPGLPESDNVIFLLKYVYDHLESIFVDHPNLPGCAPVDPLFLEAAGVFENCLPNDINPETRYTIKTGDVNGTFVF